MRLAAIVVLVCALAACSDDDDDGPRAQSATTTSTSTSPSRRCDLTAEPVDQGASVDVVGILCDGDRLALDGQPAAFPFGGTVTHGEGIRCGDDGLTVLSATSDDGVTYEAVAVTYAVRDTDLVEIDRETSTIDATTEPEVLDPYYRLDC